MFFWKLFKTDNILYRKILIHRFNELRYTVFNKQHPSPLVDILNICVKYNLYKAVCKWFDTCLIPPKREWQSTVFKAVSVHEYGFWRANCLLYPSCNFCILKCALKSNYAYGGKLQKKMYICRVTVGQHFAYLLDLVV